MAYPGKKRKSFDTPKHPWQSARMVSEVELIKKYGLRNKKEVWKAQSTLRKYREEAQELLAESAESELTGHIRKEADQILGKLKRYGILKEDADIDDILALSTDAILERRLQTQVHKLGLARTLLQARQFIAHGHIAVNGRKVTVPSKMITKDEEMTIDYYGGSPISTESHPERPDQIASSIAEE